MPSTIISGVTFLMDLMHITFHTQSPGPEINYKCEEINKKKVYKNNQLYRISCGVSQSDYTRITGDQ
jgi:hypothetical protein